MENTKKTVDLEKLELPALLQYAKDAYAKIEAMITEAATAAATIDALKSEAATAAATIETSAKELEAVKEELEQTIEINSELVAEVSKLNADGKEVPPRVKPVNSKIPTETFEVDGVEHKVVFGKVTTKDHGTVTAEDVLASPALQEYLVKMGSGMVKAV